ncbi:ANTH-domain-containing protein [Auricularia subglabra TFB-10046 SS5]|nr:ANTH-domain-containing protein [Auricularia subglabra TFB-10046 SS5]
MSSFDKVVKLACKPKAAPPKSKYIDPILAATYGDESTIHDLCRSLVPRLHESNPVIVFKALLVLHTMIRNGQTDNVLGYLARHDELHLRNIATGHQDGYTTPKNLAAYGAYLDTRIKAFRELKHDPVRVQAETNRDMRMSAALDEPSSSSRRPGSGGGRDGPSLTEGAMQRSKTIMGRKLRVMTVEKGLLRETKIVQKVIDSVLECTFYFDDLEDDLVLCALRLLVKDLLVLFQACNEGVINVLEHYFEMSKVDATSALQIYRHFCKQAERVLEYVAVAKKLQNLLNVPVPNLRHAPVSLAGALEEYLNDTNFEQNRIEYKTNKALADENLKSGKSGIVPKSARTKTPPPPLPTVTTPTSATTNGDAPASAQANKSMQDFLNSIEEQQPTMFNPQTASPSAAYFQQQAQQTGFNPFRQSMLMPQGTGFPGAVPPFVGQPTGFPSAAPFVPQATGMPVQSGSPFPMQSASPFQPQATGMPFVQPQQTAMPSFLNTQPQMPMQPGFLQPQQTGANPFRQSMLLPQMTGPASLSLGAFGSGASPNTAVNGNAAPWAAPSSPPHVPARPASTPLQASAGSTVSAGGIITHATGSRNPFGVPVQPAPPVPKPPTLQELVAGGAGAFPRAASPKLTQANGAQAGAISSIASSFARSNRPTSPTSPSRLGFGPGLPTVPESGAITNSLAGLSIGSGSASGGASPLQSQTTGFGGLKAFKPTSSFGASLVESLPPVASPTNNNPSVSSQPTGAMTNQPFGSSSSPFSLGTQPTGAFGSASPFAALQTGSSTTSSATASTASSTPFSILSGASSNTSNTTAGTGSSIFGSSGLQPQLTAMPFSNGSLSPSSGLQQQHTATPGNAGAMPFSSSLGGLSSFGSTSSPFGSSGALNAQPTSTPMLRPQTTGGPNPFRASMFVAGGDAPTMPAFAGMRAPFSSNPNASIQLGAPGQQQQQNSPFPQQQSLI